MVDGRFFNDYDEQSVKGLLKRNGFEVIEIFITLDAREGRKGEKWVNVVGRKVKEKGN